MVHLAHRALVNGANVGEQVLDGVDLASTAIRTLVDDIIASQEEVRGLLADLIAVADETTPSGPAVLAESLSTREVRGGGTRFDSAARR